MTIIGITGGSGAGKTTVLKVLEKLGARVIDCDGVYHDLLNTSEPMAAEIGKIFPEAVKNGRVDRKIIGNEVFSDPDKLKKLTSITDVYVLNAVRGIIDEEAGRKGKLCVIDAIGLFESGLNNVCSFTVAVTAPREKRIERIVAREGISREYAEKRVNAQKSERFYVEKCDCVLSNDGDDEEMFASRCEKFFDELLGRQANV